MFSLRSIFFRPKKSDYPLAKFFYADLELRRITQDLDSFDGSKEPVRCQKLIERLRKTQQRVMEVLWVIVRSAVLEETRASRQYRDKFPEELRGDHMSGPLWFGAECLAAGSSVLNHEDESDELRPLARHITKVMESVRTKLREQCLRDVACYPEDLVDALRWFDYNWAEFEFSYVSRMCPVKTTEQLHQQQLVTVLFSETTAISLKEGIITEDQMSSYDPVLMLAIPRLSILDGLEKEGGILDLSQEITCIPEYFRPYISVLSDIKASLTNMSEEQKNSLKVCLATSQDPEHCPSEPTASNSEAQNVMQCLYLAISSIADQMISNHAKDLRTMLHNTFKINQFDSSNVSLPTCGAKVELPHLSSTECVEPSSSGDEVMEGDEERGDDCSSMLDESISISDIRQAQQEAPEWVPDNAVTNCALCKDPFSLIRRKHHCRNCGQIYCSNCTTNNALLTFTKAKCPVRVCDTCYQSLPQPVTT